MQLFSESLDQYDESKLHNFKEAVINMNPGSDDKDYIEKFNAARYSVLNKLEQELENRKKKKSIIQLPGSGQLEMFSILESELMSKAAQVESRVDVEAEDIIKVCSGDAALTMDFIKLADNYLESGSNFDLNELIHGMQSKSIPVVSSNRSFKSTFVKDFYILIAEFLEVHYNVPERDSDNQAKFLLEQAFDEEGFEDDLLEVYKNTTDRKGGNRAIEVARLLVHYDIFDDSLITYFRNNL